MPQNKENTLVLNPKIENEKDTTGLMNIAISVFSHNLI